MKKTSIQIGKTYEVKAGRNTTTVKVKSFNRKTGGWVCATTNGKAINVKDAARFVREVVAKKSATKTGLAKGGKPNGKPLSGINAAYRVLKEAKRPLRVKEIAEIALANGYCKLKGMTPEFTISAVLQRDIKDKGAKSRFVKPERGLFAAR